jgi:hypothetical protein
VAAQSQARPHGSSVDRAIGIARAPERHAAGGTMPLRTPMASVWEEIARAILSDHYLGADGRCACGHPFANCPVARRAQQHELLFLRGTLGRPGRWYSRAEVGSASTRHGPWTR